MNSTYIEHALESYDSFVLSLKQIKSALSISELILMIINKFNLYLNTIFLYDWNFRILEKEQSINYIMTIMLFHNWNLIIFISKLLFQDWSQNIRTGYLIHIIISDYFLAKDVNNSLKFHSEKDIVYDLAFVRSHTRSFCQQWSNRIKSEEILFEVACNQFGHSDGKYYKWDGTSWNKCHKLEVAPTFDNLSLYDLFLSVSQISFRSLYATDGDEIVPLSELPIIKCSYLIENAQSRLREKLFEFYSIASFFDIYYYKLLHVLHDRIIVHQRKY